MFCRIFTHNGATVLVDPISYDFVKGATIDFVQEMIKSSFAVLNNANAEKSCGCGHSFSPAAS